jgi:hypothetical protein
MMPLLLLVFSTVFNCRFVIHDVNDSQKVAFVEIDEDPFVLHLAHWRGYYHAVLLPEEL